MPLAECSPRGSEPDDLFPLPRGLTCTLVLWDYMMRVVMDSIVFLRFYASLLGF